MVDYEGRHISEKDNRADEWKIVEETEFAGDQPHHRHEVDTSSDSRYCRSCVRIIESRGEMETVREFIDNAVDRNYKTYDDPTALSEGLHAYKAALADTFTLGDAAKIRGYSGFSEFQLVNQVARGIWNPDILGPKTEKLMARAKELTTDIQDTLERAPSLGEDTAVFRDTNLDGFRDYGIHSLDELTKLQNQFYIDRGFLSTSMTRDESFFQKGFDDTYRKPCNIQIRYQVPKEFHKGIALINKELSYSPQQNEYLMDKSLLSYISDVQIDSENDCAYLTATVIPTELYDHP